LESKDELVVSKGLRPALIRVLAIFCAISELDNEVGLAVMGVFLNVCNNFCVAISTIIS
jgi:hypothetical protein